MKKYEKCRRVNNHEFILVLGLTLFATVINQHRSRRAHIRANIYTPIRPLCRESIDYSLAAFHN